jgi:hypothetical protein
MQRRAAAGTVGMDDRRSRRRIRLAPLAILAALLLASALGGLAYMWQAGGAESEPSAAGGMAALEERYGVRITLVAVTAAGGLVDLRYQVIDAEKAAQVFGEGARAPTLIAEDSGVTLPNPQEAPGETQPEAGQTYYVLYPNVESSVKPGTPVTVVIGDIRVEHLVAK